MSFKRHIPKLIGTLVVLVVGVFMIRFVQDFLSTPPAAPKKGPQQITLLTPPPPPPPVEKPPEPEVKEEVKLEEPEPVEEMPEEASDEPPPGDLGVDADGGAGGDGFGLIGRKGGRGLLNGAGNPFSYYGSQVSRRIEDALLAVDELRKLNYSVDVEIWVGTDGRVERAKLVRSTGNSTTDGLMSDAILRAQSVALAPPPGMPQPIRIRVSSRL